MRRSPSCLASVLLCVTSVGVGFAAEPMKTGVAAGERLYLEGLSASGLPVTGTVVGDVPVSGSQFSCVNCHLRSGMGSSEGTIVAPPVAAPILFSPRTGESRKRPAYDEETLARAIKGGVAPGGRTLDALMPRYALSDADVRSLGDYLRTLSAEPSPGVTASTLTFATVVSEAVVPAQRAAMLEVLQTYVRFKNGRTRDESRRAERSAALKEPTYAAWREWTLRVWELRGPASTWPDQLEAYYRKEPAFALLSGMAVGDWSPIHDWCERRRVPCLLPMTDRPALREHDFYTLYFSKGVALEAQAVATRLAGIPASGRILQAFRGDGAGATAASELRRSLGALHGTARIDDLVLASGKPIAEALRESIASSPPEALVLWLGRADVDSVAAAGACAQIGTVYLSGALSGLDSNASLSGLGAKPTLVSPFSHPDEAARRGKRIEVWLKQRDLPMTEFRIRDQAFFAAMTAGEGLMHIRSYFYRDYFLELTDHTSGAAFYSATYPRLSFGPGQRYLAKGCYLDSLAPGRPHGGADTWVVP